MSEVISCIDCNAACCRAGNRFQLNPNEIKIMGVDSRNEVINLSTLSENRPPTYEIDKDCINLVENDFDESKPEFSCRIHGTIAQPKCCKFVVPGGEYCLYARSKWLETETPIENKNEFISMIPPTD